MTRSHLHEHIDQLYSTHYERLKRLAHSRRDKHERVLGTRTIVHEAYIRLRKKSPDHFATADHFLAYVACVMRSLVIGGVRGAHAQRRGGRAEVVELTDSAETQVAGTFPPGGGDDFDKALENSLQRLERVDRRAATVARMRLRYDKDELEIAQALGVDKRTVRRHWRKANLLLRADLA